MGSEQSEFIEFYETSRDACLRAVMVVTGDRALAEELVAEAFARAWTSWRKVGRYAAPQGWVVRTALNAGISRWRRHRRELPLGAHGDTVVADPDGRVERSVVDPAVVDPAVVDPAILDALRRLPARQREVIALRFFLDLDTRATAQVLGIAPGTVTAHLSRAVTALRCEPALRDGHALPDHPGITTMEVTSE